ncbi:protein of unknown function [Methylococcus capsulatus]|uniref:Uncharacterized protein n=1 Tax=Methylococcus capsulatus TaxID=414 RepID=A0AA35XZ24_METCP|nr:protein of unknown function [Methylococcus capsulatus]
MDHDSIECGEMSQGPVMNEELWRPGTLPLCPMAVSNKDTCSDIVHLVHTRREHSDNRVSVPKY